MIPEHGHVSPEFQEQNKFAFKSLKLITFNPMKDILAENLTIEYELLREKETLTALWNFDLLIQSGEFVVIVGPSGCGKTTLGRTVLRLQEPTSGQISFDGRDITHLDAEELKPLRQSMQIIFQDPYASLNPRHTVEDIVGLPMKLHEGLNRQQCRERVQELLARVGLQSSQMQCYPHQFSGGQRQRIGIARALILKPTFVVCDEPVSALDVSIQAQILEMSGRVLSFCDRFLGY